MRYFIIFYTLLSERRRGYGNFTWVDKNYPSRNNLQNFLIRDTDCNINDYIITNVQEVTKKDHDCWIE